MGVLKTNSMTNDGVMNSDDLCPNTDPGAVVDADGCAQNQLDDDNDGVMNSDDLCPNTDPGAVDAVGCAQIKLMTTTMA